MTMGEDGEFKRVLGYKTILLITINSIMGTGIFFLPAMGAKMSGPMSIISWIIMSIIAIYISMCFAELVSIFPKAGGIYEYCKQAYGSFTSFVIGWTTLLSGNITIAMLVVGAVRYLNPNLPNIAKICIGLFFVFIFNFMAYRGMQTSAVMLVTFALITLTSIVGLIIPGLFYFDTNNIVPFVTHEWSLVFVTIFFIAETFFGWETATFLSEETKNPEKVMPKALIVGTSCIAVLSITLVVIMLGVLNWKNLGTSAAPLAEISALFFGSTGSTIFTLLVYLSIIGSVAGWIVSAPRLILALAEDKLFLRQCADIHPKNGTPHIAILFQTILTSILVIMGAGSYETLLELLLPLVLVIYSFTILSVVVLRFKMPDLHRPYKMPFGKVGPVLLVLFLLGLVGYWLYAVPHAFHTFRLGISFVFLGIPVYLLLMLYYNPDAIQKVQDKFAHIKRFTENFELPRRVRKEILTLLGNIAGKNVLEHGCSIGTLTLELAEKVGPYGKIYATNISKGEIDVLQARLNKNEIINVSAIHDEHHSSRIHPAIPLVDVFVSVATLGYTQDIKKMAKEMNARLPVGGKIVIVEYIDLYKFFPNAGWLRHPKQIDSIFREQGFLVRVIKKKGLLWNYLYIYGVKTSKNAVPYI